MSFVHSKLGLKSYLPACVERSWWLALACVPACWLIAVHLSSTVWSKEFPGLEAGRFDQKRIR